jgi:apolipoprotein N-acyltransferase
MGPGALAFVCLVPLLAAIHGAPPGRAFLGGWLAGVTAHLVGMAWVADTVHTYGALPYALAWPAALLLAAALGAYTGLFAAGVSVLAWGRVPLALSAPLLWVALEYLQTHLFTGLPWNLLGHALYQQVRLVQVADLAGIYGVSWFVATVNLSLFALVLPWVDRTRRFRQSHFVNHGITLLLVPIVVATYGQVRIASMSLERQEHPDPAGPLAVRLVQPAIPQDVKWNPSYREETLERLEALSRRPAPQAPDLIVWPEASAPLVLEYAPDYLRRVRALARDLGAHLMVGSLAPVPARRGAVTNSLYLVGPDGAVAGRVAKGHLVPFGEYVPLEPLLPFVRRMTQGIGDVTPGHGSFLLPLPWGPAAVAVCYEVIFPDLVRRRMADGAAFLVTVTNDAWFGRSAALEQHFANAVFRAVENRAYVVRAANTGISGMVDPYGIIQARTDPEEAAALDVTIRRPLDPPFYTRHGDVAALGSGMMSLVFLGTALLGRSRQSRRGGGP